MLNVENILTAMQSALEAHSWTTDPAPAFVRRGPIVPGDLTMPGIGIVQGEAEEDGGTLAGDAYIANFKWQVAVAIGLEDPAQVLARLLQYRDEMKAVAIAAEGGRWGLEEVVGPTLATRWRAYVADRPVPTAVLELDMDVRVLDVAEAPDEVLMPVSVKMVATGVYIWIEMTYWPEGATGIIEARVLTYPGLVFVNSGVSSDGNPAAGPVITGLTIGQQYIAEFKTQATSEGYTDLEDWTHLTGPWTQPPRGTELDLEYVAP